MGVTRRIAIALGLGSALAAGIPGLAAAQEDSLTIFDWSGYEDPNFYPKYVEKNGGEPTSPSSATRTRRSRRCVPASRPISATPARRAW